MTMTNNRHLIQLTEAEQFFYDHAGYSRAPDEPTYSGRTRTAVLLAAAEETAKRKGWSVVWDMPTDHYFMFGAEHWTATLWDKTNTFILASLGSIDLGYDEHGLTAYPSEVPYARVVAAELASEALSEK